MAVRGCAPEVASRRCGLVQRDVDATTRLCQNKPTADSCVREPLPGSCPFAQDGAPSVKHPADAVDPACLGLPQPLRELVARERARALRVPEACTGRACMTPTCLPWGGPGRTVPSAAAMPCCPVPTAHVPRPLHAFVPPPSPPRSLSHSGITHTRYTCMPPWCIEHSHPKATLLLAPDCLLPPDTTPPCPALAPLPLRRPLPAATHPPFLGCTTLPPAGGPALGCTASRPHFLGRLPFPRGLPPPLLGLLLPLLPAPGAPLSNSIRLTALGTRLLLGVTSSRVVACSAAAAAGQGACSKLLRRRRCLETERLPGDRAAASRSLPPTTQQQSGAQLPT